MASTSIIAALLRKAAFPSCSRKRVIALGAQARLYCQSTRKEEGLKQTPLHQFHLSNGGKMVPFAGWSMPVQYSDLSVINSSLHTRSDSSLFDVSHMLQTEMSGEDAERFLEFLTVANLADLKIGSAVLSMFTTAQGGIIDDCIITRSGPHSFFVVSNAGRAEEVQGNVKTQLSEFGSDKIAITPLSDRALVALQGPKSAAVLQEGVNGDLSQMKFMTSSVMSIFGISNCRVSRCGYTGEDGFEISVPSINVIQLVEALLSNERVKLAGLGARDILRLEAGLCLYGNDISEETTPIEAGLAWCIDKRRREDGKFIGSIPILQQLKDKPARRRVGLELSSGPPARQGCQVMDSEGKNEIGVITSGTPSPTLQCNIAMGYLSRRFCKAGTKVSVQVRKHLVEAQVVKMPFVASKYYT